MRCTVRIMFLEIHNEEVKDLLHPDTPARVLPFCLLFVSFPLILLPLLLFIFPSSSSSYSSFALLLRLFILFCLLLVVVLLSFQCNSTLGCCSSSTTSPDLPVLLLLPVASMPCAKSCDTFFWERTTRKSTICCTHSINPICKTHQGYTGQTNEHGCAFPSALLFTTASNTTRHTGRVNVSICKVFFLFWVPNIPKPGMIQDHDKCTCCYAEHCHQRDFRWTDHSCGGKR